ncbi:MAG: DUF983 domain-containing protein [Ferruginibacter sp.]|nr:DUF983 domain-containing protein [Cytophagales bacterium]
MKNASKLRAILGEQCPRCRQGKMFKYSGLNMAKFADMHEHCPHCGLQFEIEPGFFIGAMYFSYAFSVATVIIVGFGVYYLGRDPDTWVYLSVVTAALVLTIPFMFRYARVLMLHYFAGVSYERGFSEQQG